MDALFKHLLQVLTAMRIHLASASSFATLLFSFANVKGADVISSSEGVYNSSRTPANLPWNTYNYCNAPHVNAKHYNVPFVKGAKLVYLNMVMRHHKVEYLASYLGINSSNRYYTLENTR